MCRFKSGLVSLVWLVAVAMFALGCQPEAGEFIGKGESALERGEYDEALEHYNKALEIDPDNPDAALGIAKVYLETGKIDDAISQFLNIQEKVESEGQKQAIGIMMAEAYLAKAEDLWRKGAYRQDPSQEAKIEETALKAAETGEDLIKKRSYGLLVALYDYQFERYRGEYEQAEEGARDAMRQIELDHIDKVFTNVRPSKEFKKRLRSRMKELTEQAFLDQANKVFAEKVKPELEKDPNITVTNDKIGVVVQLALTETTLANLADETFMAQENAQVLLMTPYYEVSKELTVDVVEIIVAGMLGQPKLNQNILPSRVETYKVDSEEILEAELTPEFAPKLGLQPEPGKTVKYVKVVGSMTLEEIRELAFDYQLYLETEGKAGDKKDGDKKDGDAAPAGDAPAPAGDAPAGDAPAGDAPAGDAPAGEAPAGEAPAGEAPAGDAPAEGTTP